MRNWIFVEFAGLLYLSVFAMAMRARVRRAR
jgi:hypothetical protein